MTAPHFHTVDEAKAAIRKIGHDAEHDSGPPTGISGGSSGNLTSSTKEVLPSGAQKGHDWADRRKIKPSGR